MKNFIKIFSLLFFILFATSVVYAQHNTMPKVQIGFKSTSTMPACGSNYLSTPVINEYGMAEYSGSPYSPNSVDPRRTTMENQNPGTPGNPWEENQLPFGDCPVWLLVLFTIGYCYYKKRKTASV